MQGDEFLSILFSHKLKLPNRDETSSFLFCSLQNLCHTYHTSLTPVLFFLPSFYYDQRSLNIPNFTFFELATRLEASPNSRSKLRTVEDHARIMHYHNARGPRIESGRVLRIIFPLDQRQSGEKPKPTTSPPRPPGEKEHFGAGSHARESFIILMFIYSNVEQTSKVAATRCDLAARGRQATRCDCLQRGTATIWLSNSIFELKCLNFKCTTMGVRVCAGVRVAHACWRWCVCVPVPRR